MDRVVENRIKWNQIDIEQEHIGKVALLDCGYIDSLIDICWDTGCDGPYLVVDCAAKHDVKQLIKTNFVVDVDWETAVRHKMVRPVPVTISITNTGLAQGEKEERTP